MQSFKAVYLILSHLIFISGLAPGHLFLLGWSHCVVVRTVVVVRRTRWRIVADAGVQQFPDRKVGSRNHSYVFNRQFRSVFFCYRLIFTWCKAPARWLEDLVSCWDIPGSPRLVVSPECGSPSLPSSLGCRRPVRECEVQLTVSREK